MCSYIYHMFLMCLHIFISLNVCFMLSIARAVFQRHDISLHQAPTPNIGFSKVSKIDAELSARSCV